MALADNVDAFAGRVAEEFVAVREELGLKLAKVDGTPVLGVVPTQAEYAGITPDDSTLYFVTA